jgi:hypothetical protein
MLCMRAAANFSAASVPVYSYGVGKVNVCGEARYLPTAMDVATRNKILTNFSVLDQVEQADCMKAVG